MIFVARENIYTVLMAINANNMFVTVIFRILDTVPKEIFEFD